jgi:hypothetical protein
MNATPAIVGAVCDRAFFPVINEKRAVTDRAYSGRGATRHAEKAHPVTG